jgi:NADH pyrophosphatase NudC (nudix superfamily)
MAVLTAKYNGGEIHAGHEELADTQWFSAYNFPEMPGRKTITACRLIDWFMDTYKSVSQNLL